MKLSEAIVLKARYEKELSKLYNKAQEIRMVLIQPGEDINEYIDEHPDRIFEQIQNYNNAIASLGALIRFTNESVIVDVGTSQLRLSGVINAAISMRRLLKSLEEFASTPKRERTNGYGDSSSLVRVATFDVEKYRQLAKEQKDDVEKLSALIDAANAENEIEFDPSVFFKNA